MLFEIKLQPFDSGRLAPRVGSVVLGPNIVLCESNLAELMGQALCENYNLIFIAANDSQPAAQRHFVGRLVEYEGRFEELLDNTSAANTSYRFRGWETQADWRGVEELISHSAGTRFFLDPNIDRESAVAHKLAMLKQILATRAANLTFAFSSTGEFTAYICTYLEDDVMFLYEVAVAPEHRRQSLTVAHTNFNLATLAARFGTPQLVRTRVYATNLPSILLCKGLGLRSSGQATNYYHLWPAADVAA